MVDEGPHVCSSKGAVERPRLELDVVTPYEGPLSEGMGDTFKGVALDAGRGGEGDARVAHGQSVPKKRTQAEARPAAEPSSPVKVTFMKGFALLRWTVMICMPSAVRASVAETVAAA